MKQPLRSSLLSLLAVAALGLSVGGAQDESRPCRLTSTNGTVIIAHRGGAEESTENTIEAFQRALRIGAQGIETDLRLARDGTVILYHNEYSASAATRPLPQAVLPSRRTCGRRPYR